MKLLKLVLRNSFRHRLRTSLTILGLALAVVAFGLIQTFIAAWYSQAAAAAPDRLVTRHAASIVFTLPLSYKEQLLKIDGVEQVTYGNWFGGVYVDPQNFFPQFAIDATTYFEIYPEFIVEPDQYEAFLGERRAALVGRALADRFGWKVGDMITLIGTIYPGDWDFVIRGIYTGKEEITDEGTFYFHWEYVDEAMKQQMPGRAGQIGWFVLQIDNPDRAAAISTAVDERFSNSWAETLTETEEAFTLSFIQFAAAIIAGLRVVSVLIVGVILLVLANTMVMTARERISEYAFMKTLGFRSYHLIGLILGESFFISFVGGIVGIGLLALVARLVAAALSNYLYGFAVPQSTYFHALAVAFVVGLAAAIFPIQRAIRIRIVEGLRVVD
ncbi:MAG: ABC transporter permease [candidate division Zixibacteria bacterium]|nr:ABC transporter permease [candidate division Zixibacteria bacterium]